MMKYIMCCPICKGEYAYSTDESQKPSLKLIPAAELWKYMDGTPVVAGTVMFCEKCQLPFQPLIEDVKTEEVDHV